MTRRPGVALGVVAGAAFVAPFAEGHWLFPLGSINHDETMYTFAARLLRAGHLTLPASYVPFRPWASGTEGGHVILKYTPVWPGVLAAAAGVGSMRVGVAAAAAAAVVLTGLLGKELFGRWTEGLIAAVMLVLSPLFLVQAGTFLSYLFQLVLDLAIVLLAIGAIRRWPAHGRAPRGAVVRLAGAGAVWGVAVFAREYDALLIAVPLGIAAVVTGRHPMRRLGTWLAWAGAGAAAPLAALFAYNWALLGNPMRNSFSITGKDDTLLFGRRGVFPSTAFPFTVHDAAVSFIRNLTQLPSWLFGGVVLVALAGLGVWRNRRRGAAIWAVAGIAGSFAVGYSLFWSPYSIVALWPGSATLGPFYLVALLIPLTLFGAAGLASVLDRSRAGAIAIVVVMVAVTGAGVTAKIDRNRQVTRQYEAAKRLVDHARLSRAVLFMDDRGPQGFSSSEPFLENQPDLHQPVVYAVESGHNDLPVIKEFPGRTPYRIRSEIRPGDDLLHPTRFIEQLHVRTGKAVELRFRIVNTVGARVVLTHFHTAGVDRFVVLDTHSTKGATYTFSWILTDATPPFLPVTTVKLPISLGTAEVEAVFVQPGTIEHYLLQYPYAVAPGHTTVITPGWGRYLFQYLHATWLDEQVSPTLSEISPLATSAPRGPSPSRPTPARGRRFLRAPASRYRERS